MFFQKVMHFLFCWSFHHGIHIKPFSSANGENDIKGALCRIKEIRINGFSVSDFPFYLIDDQEHSIALIGYDFISSCDMVQIQNSTMEFYNFDYNAMCEKMDSMDALDLLPLQDDII